jgi:hypothetical protein
MLTNRLKESCCTRRVALIATCLALFILMAISSGAKDKIYKPQTEPKDEIQHDESEVDDPYETVAPKEEPPATKGGVSNLVEYEAKEPKDTGDGKQNAKTIADRLLDDLLKKIGKGRGPIIVGGIGDSGTRGVREVLINMGTEMLQYPYVMAISKDSEVFMAERETTTSKGHTWMRRPLTIYGKAMAKVHSLKFNETILPFDFWHTARQYVAKMVTESMETSQKNRKNAQSLDPWGFKHPRTSLLLPLFVDSLKSKFLFVHVIRNDLDVVSNDNTRFFVGKIRTCELGRTFTNIYARAMPCILWPSMPKHPPRTS